jgi:hypothetical protein
LHVFVQELYDDLSVKRRELLTFKASGLCDGQMLPQNQLDNMADRFDKLTVKLEQLRKKMAYEHSKYILLALINSTESRLKMWTIKYGGREGVQALLEDHQVWPC